MNPHEHYLPSFSECVDTVSHNGDAIFYSVEQVLPDGTRATLFNYNRATYENFVTPLPGSLMHARELRGLTYLHHGDGTVDRWPLLDKFFNVGQTPCSMMDVLAGLTIDNVHIKEDGSVVSFVRTPQGNVFARSKMSFSSDQAIRSQFLFDNDAKVREAVTGLLGMGLVPVFEYVSPDNRVVIKYQKEELVLLRLRDLVTGVYIDPFSVSGIGDLVRIADRENFTDLYTLEKEVEKMEEKEGVVVQFTDQKLVKWKSPWYLERHRIFTDQLNRENSMIGLILDNKMDDILGLVDDDKRMEVMVLENLVTKEMQRLSVECDHICSFFEGDIPSFARRFSKDPLFPVVIGVIRGKDKFALIEQQIRRRTDSLMSAREWVSKVSSQ